MLATITKSLCVVAVMLAASLPIAAEELDFYTLDDVAYASNIAKPQQVLGHTVGDHPIRYDLMMRYLDVLAQQSDRISIETLGYSHEKRPLKMLVITHPDNHLRLEDIRTAHLSRTSGKPVDPSLPVVTWINFGVHGAEASGLDAFIPTAYHFAAATGAEIENQLKNSVILLVGGFNPDGHDRRANWHSSYLSTVPNADANHEIHNQMWPGGRTNHYWFDLNRQWLLQTQPESIAWLHAWQYWKPHVTGDMHEMGSASSYYFHPGVPSRKFPLIPAKGRDLLVEISSYYRQWMDAEAKLYFNEEGFDNFYVGKGSTYPQVNGGLGILFEAGGQMGIVKDTPQGTKHHGTNVRNHMRNALATVEGAVAMRAKLLDYGAQFFADSLADAKKDPVQAYIFAAPEDPMRQAKFVQLLARHGITVDDLMADITVDGQRFSKWAKVVRVDQSQYRFIKSIFNRFTDFPDKVFYDVSGWTLPELYGLQWTELSARDLKKAQIQPLMDISPRLSVDDAPYAYAFSWSNYYAPRAVNALLKAGVRVRMTMKPATMQSTRGPVSLDRGAVIVAQDYQDISWDSISQMIRVQAQDGGFKVHSVTSGHTLNVGRELGGRNDVIDLTAPKPLLVVGDGISPYDAGEVWHQLDHRMNIAVTLVRSSRLSRVDLGAYTHLILTTGQPVFRGKEMDILKAWVRSGGTVLATRNQAEWAQAALLGRTAVKVDLPKPDASLTYDQKAQADARHVIGGAVFRGLMDITHPMAFGFAREAVAVHKNAGIVLAPSDDPYAVIGSYAAKPLISGYASAEQQKRIAGQPLMVAERLGAGSVVLYADNPNFRATYLGVEKLFLNGLFLSKAFRPARTPREEVEAQADHHAHTH